jgi:predicted hydrocarbon binding protein
MNSLDLARGIYAPGRAIFGFIVRVANKPGVLWRVSKVFSDFNVNILGAAIPTLTPEVGETMLFFITDFTGSGASPGGILSELRKLDVVLNASIAVEEVEGGIFDTAHFPLTVHDVRCILLTEPALKGMVETLRREMGSGGAAILFHIGSFMGSEVAKYYIEKYGIKDLVKVFTLMKYLIVAWGWGVVMDVRVDVEKVRVELSVRGLWECSLYSGLTDSQSHFFRGFLAGFSSVMFNTSMGAVEVKCIAKGDECCRFIVEKRFSG